MTISLAIASSSSSSPVQPATHSFRQRRSSSSFAPRAAQARFPNQASSVAGKLSLSSPTGAISLKSTVHAKTLTIPCPSRPSRLSILGPHRPHDPPRLSILGPHRPLDPPRASDPLHCSSIVWFRWDLRIHDNECLNAAHNESNSVLHVLCFDPRHLGQSSVFDSFLESVSDLRRRLRDRGSDLVVVVDRPEEVLPRMARAVGAEALYAHCAILPEEVKSEERVKAAMEEEGVKVKYLWGSTLFHIDDLPFKLEDMPTNYSRFKETLPGVKVRETIAALDRLKGLPKIGDVEPGEIPTLEDLGVTGKAPMSQVVGGETEALQWLNEFIAKCQALPNEGTDLDKFYQVNMSSNRFRLRLGDGCLSPRALFEGLKNVISAHSKNNDGGSSSTVSNMWMEKLLSRDFRRFKHRKDSSPVKQGAPACTGALV